MPPKSPGSDAKAFFTTESWTVGVVGLGYVGLPLLLTAHQAGLDAIGFEVSARRVASIREGRSPVDDIDETVLAAALTAGLRITDEASALAEADAILICVPSPLGPNREPDLSYIEAAARTIAEVARPGQLIVLESTTYPGTTEDILLPAVAKAGLVIDENVWVAFSPERVSPGDGPQPGDIPKLVGGITPRSTEVAVAAYQRFTATVHPVSSARVAEMAKLLENTYRAVNIGLVNEMAQLAHLLDIDIWEVIDAAATKPFGFQPFWPGPGVGGHCIPLDPQYLAWRARAANFDARFIDLAEATNSRMPGYNATRIADLLAARSGDVRGSRILAVGAAYKRGIADARESASVQVIHELESMGARVAVLDPVVGVEALAAMGLTPHHPGQGFEDYALAAVLTDHDGIEYEALARQVPVVYDARGVYRRLGIDTDNVVPL